jgi:hypothetical protein
MLSRQALVIDTSGAVMKNKKPTTLIKFQNPNSKEVQSIKAKGKNAKKTRILGFVLFAIGI